MRSRGHLLGAQQRALESADEPPGAGAARSRRDTGGQILSLDLAISELRASHLVGADVVTPDLAVGELLGRHRTLADVGDLDLAARLRRRRRQLIDCDPWSARISGP